MAEKAKVKIGTKVDPAEAKKIDPARIGKPTVETNPGSEVEGQAPGAGYAECPWCGKKLRGDYSDTYLSYRCPSCGGHFELARIRR